MRRLAWLRALSIALVILQGCGAPASPRALVSTVAYTDATGTLTLHAPLDWEIVDLGEGERALVIATPADLEPAEASAEGMLDVPMFAVMLLPTVQVDAAQALESLLPEETADAALEIETGQLMGYPMAEVTLEYGVPGGAAMCELRVVALADSREMRIRGTATAGKWEQYEPIFREMLSSIQVHP